MSVTSILCIVPENMTHFLFSLFYYLSLLYIRSLFFFSEINYDKKEVIKKQSLFYSDLKGLSDKISN